MALKLWLGPSGSGKTHDMFAYAIKNAQEHPELTYYVIVPEQFTLSVQQKLVNMHPSHGILNIDVLSFNRLAHRVFEEVGYGKNAGELIDDMAKNLILMHLCRQHEDKLCFVGENLHHLGYISEIKSVISEFMQYKITPDMAEAIATTAQETGNDRLAAKMSDIVFLYKEFLTFLADRYSTKEELLTRVSEVIPQSDKIKQGVFILDGYTGFTPVQYELIGQLLRYAKDVHISVLMDLAETSADDFLSSSDGGRRFFPRQIKAQELFAMSKTMVCKLDKLAETCGCIRESDYETLLDHSGNDYHSGNDHKYGDHKRRTDIPALLHLEANLFRPKSSAFAGEASEITIDCAADMHREVAILARRIIRLVKHTGCQYKDIAVVSAALSEYRHEIEDVFLLHDIPFFIDQSQPLLMNAFVEYVRALIDVVADSYTYESVFRFLRSSLTDIPEEDIDLLENYIIAKGISGKRAWHEMFVSPLSRQKLPKESDEDYTNRITAEMLHLNDIRIRVTCIFDRFAELLGNPQDNRCKLQVSVFTDAVVNMLEENHLRDALDLLSDEFRDSGEKGLSSEYDQIYDKVIQIFDRMRDFLGEDSITIGEFVTLLDASLKELHTGIIPCGTDYVQVGDLTRTRLSEVKHLFVVGANEGFIPSVTSSMGLLTDADRRILCDQHPDLVLKPSIREKGYEQRLYLYMMLTKPSCGLHLSYAGVNPDGETLRPSYLISVFTKLFPTVPISYEDGSLLEEIVDKRSAQTLALSLYRDALNNNVIYKNANDDLKDYLLLLKLCTLLPDVRDRICSLLGDDLTRVSEDSDGTFLAKKTAELLYGKKLTGSVTRLETFAKCAYKYYLLYGLNLSEREVFSFERNDMGMVFHGALENFGVLMNEQGKNWFDITVDEMHSLMDEAVKRTVAEDGMAALYATKRSAYLVKRMSAIMRRTVDVLSYQIRQGRFVPENFEMGFETLSNLDSLNFTLSPEETMRLYGRIDRVDVYRDEAVTYVKIIDYKSSSHDLSLAAVYEGTQLQLVVYLNVAMEMLKQSHPGETIMPAGVLYYHIDDPMIQTVETDYDKINAEIRKTLKMSGYVSSEKDVALFMDAALDTEKKSDVIPVSYKADGTFTKNSHTLSSEEFALVSDFVNARITQLGRRIVSGDITPNPTDEKNCSYCEYRAICRLQTAGSQVTVSSSEDSQDTDTDVTDETGKVTDEEALLLMRQFLTEQ